MPRGTDAPHGAGDRRRRPSAARRRLAIAVRHAAANQRASEADWDRHRLALGLPDGSRDLEPEKTVLLEAGFDELNGVSWSKGCYMGQELTARTKYRGLVKRRLVPVAVTGSLPPPGTPVLRDGDRGRHDALRPRPVGTGGAADRCDARDADVRRSDACSATAPVDDAAGGSGMTDHDTDILLWSERPGELLRRRAAGELVPAAGELPSDEP